MEILVKWTVLGLEAASLATIVLGFCASGVISLLAITKNVQEGRYTKFRRNVARTILVALELLIAADILRSLVLEPSLTSLAVLAALVGIRTFLSFSIDVELDGCWPWERAKLRPCASPSTRNLPEPGDQSTFRGNPGHAHGASQTGGSPKPVDPAEVHRMDTTSPLRTPTTGSR